MTDQNSTPTFLEWESVAVDAGELSRLTDWCDSGDDCPLMARLHYWLFDTDGQMKQLCSDCLLRALAAGGAIKPLIAVMQSSV